jgi:hypothetical protein
MPDTVRGFCAQVYEYVKSDMNSDDLSNYEESSQSLERNAEVSAARLGLSDDPQKRADAMRMMEKTSVLPILLLKKRDALDLNNDGDIDKGELETVLQDSNTSVLESIAAEYALTRFDKIRDGFDPFDWFENLETGEIWANAQRARQEPEMDPEDVYYGQVTVAPALGAAEERSGSSCCPHAQTHELTDQD